LKLGTDYDDHIDLNKADFYQNKAVNLLFQFKPTSTDSVSPYTP